MALPVQVPRQGFKAGIWRATYRLRSTAVRGREARWRSGLTSRCLRLGRSAKVPEELIPAGSALHCSIFLDTEPDEYTASDQEHRNHSLTSG